MPYTQRDLYLYDPVNRNNQFSELIRSFNNDVWLQKHQLTVDQELFHYTNIEGLEGILNSKSIWFGHAYTLNDKLEIEYGKSLILEILESRLSDNPIHNAVFENLIMYTKGFAKTMHHVYLACFCEENSLLSQWRSYSNSGLGYCLGFIFDDKSKVAYDINDIEDYKKPLLRKVIYSEEEQRRIVNQYLDFIIESINKLYDADRMGPEDELGQGNQLVRLAMDSMNTLADILCCLKHPAFSEEKEWRMIHVSLESYRPDRLSFRRVKNELVPFISLFLFDELNSQGEKKLLFPLRYIGLGPLNDLRHSKSTIELYLHNLKSKVSEIDIYPIHQIKLDQPNYYLS